MLYKLLGEVLLHVSTKRLENKPVPRKSLSFDRTMALLFCRSDDPNLRVMGPAHNKDYQDDTIAEILYDDKNTHREEPSLDEVARL